MAKKKDKLDSPRESLALFRASQFWQRGWISPSGKVYSCGTHVATAQQILASADVAEMAMPNPTANEDEYFDDYCDELYNQMFQLGYCRATRDSAPPRTMFINFPKQRSFIDYRNVLIDVARKYECESIVDARSNVTLWSNG